MGKQAGPARPKEVSGEVAGGSPEGEPQGASGEVAGGGPDWEPQGGGGAAGVAVCSRAGVHVELGGFVDFLWELSWLW